MSSSGKRVRTTVARQRSVLLRSLSASLAVTMMAGAALLAASVGTATVANADTAPPSSLSCNTSSNSTSFQTTWSDTNTFSLTPASVAAGDTVTATWTSATGLNNGSPTTLTMGSVQFQAVVALSGAMTGDVLAVTTHDTYPAADKDSGAPLGAISATTTFTASGSGALTGTVLETIFNASTLDTYCSPFVGSQVSAGPPATYVGNYPATTDPAPTYLAGYTPAIQSPATPTGHPGQTSFGDILIGASDTTVAVASVTVGAPQHPAPPSGVSGVGGDKNVKVSWVAPDTGGSPITGYTVTSDPDGKTCTSTSDLFCTVSDLTNGTPYTFTVIATNAIGDSDPSDASADVTPSAPTAPAPPSGVSGVGGDKSVKVSWVAPDTGGSPITGYAVTSDPDAQTCMTDGDLSCTVTGLTDGTPYTFTVTATNAIGTSEPSDASADVTPSAPTVPAAPSGVAGAPGDSQVTVSWVAPDTGGSPITGYTVTSDPDAQTCMTDGDLSCTVTGLTNGTPYTFTVTATNNVGTSDPSDPSDAVTPSATTPPITPPASLSCNTSNNTAAFNTAYDDTMTFTLSPAAVTAGDDVTATYTGSTGLGNGSPVTLDKGTVQVQVVAALSGAMTGNVVAVTTPNTYPTADKASGDPLGAYSASTTFTAKGSGDLTATVSELIYKGGASSLDTYCSPTATPPGNYPVAADPTITSTLLSCYLPDWQTGGYDNGQVSGTATTFASETINVTGSSATPTSTACPTPSSSPSSSPTNSTTAPPISANVPSTVTKQVSNVYCQIFTSSNGLLWNGPAAPGTAGSDSVAAPKFTVSLTPQVPKPGQKVTITVYYNVGNGAGPFDIPNGGIKLRGVIQLSGSLTNQVIVTSAALPAFAGSTTNPNSRVPAEKMAGSFTMPTASNAVVYASLLTIADDDGNSKNIGNTNADPTKGDTFNWPKVTDLYDVVCNKNLKAKSNPLTPTSGLTAADALVQPLAVSAGTIPAAAIGVTAGVPYTGTVAPPATVSSTTDVSGDTLPHTGASGVVGAGVVAAIVIQLGLILYVRSVRAVPVRRPSHA
jgi:hypothetical protein